ncbi:L-ascorbate metabolism protein UlaG, beta-lactamase superfamily [Geosmithia morbida]|uniref:L-ascorbate metabolism protein UlaG, beta-lactamase superfamily n=1 Tax=Geosmithia morbida TaxID=1094350 RepID=A0A9P4YVU3_9HYPO|nr:L-ascorbate metabolism protein UlaG, beta-lactamase superfamily [Geosmithia morbida]KAF4124043.1 L-ascorbate metabolism protein UlaG, beta-lactamase superfamily [Geosmithia morbida]
MAVSIKQLNRSSSFLLTFEPVGADALPFAQPFRILLDPECTQAESDIPAPDAIILSHDTCSDVTLRRLSTDETIVLAAPHVARKIRSRGYVDAERVQDLTPWGQQRLAARDSSTRLAVRSVQPGGEPGEITVSLITSGLRRGGGGSSSSSSSTRTALGITYRPPRPFSPPPMRHTCPAIFKPLPPTPPVTPSSCSTISLPSVVRNRVLSVVYAPHGIEYSSVQPYATSHLVSEAALPLTALIHPFDDVDRPMRWGWGRGRGRGCPRSLGVDTGLPTAVTLGARSWVRTQDAASVNIRNKNGRRCYGPDDVRHTIRYASAYPGSSRRGSRKPCVVDDRPTEVFALGCDEEVTMTNKGVWRDTEKQSDRGQPYVCQPYVLSQELEDQDDQDLPYVEQPYVERPYVEQPCVEQSYVDQPYVLSQETEHQSYRVQSHISSKETAVDSSEDWSLPAWSKYELGDVLADIDIDSKPFSEMDGIYNFTCSEVLSV